MTTERIPTIPSLRRLRANRMDAATTATAKVAMPLPRTRPLLTRSQAEPTRRRARMAEPNAPSADAEPRAATWFRVAQRSIRLAGERSREAVHAGLRLVDAHLGIGLLVVVLLLVAIGTVVVFSASAKVAMESAAIGDPAHYFKRHVFAVGLALLALVAAGALSIERWHWIAPRLYVVAMIALVAVLIPGIGTELNGARRWFRFGGGLGFQPSDFAKVALVLMLAAHLSKLRVQRSLGSLSGGFLPVALLVAPVALLVVAAPDFGTTVFLCMLACAVFLLAGGRLRHVGLAAVPGVLALGAVVVAKFEHVRPRLATYLDPTADPSGAGYQVLQGLIAVGAGGPWGVGLGQSRQSLFYLPEMSTDFIFAILAEEFGFVGTSAVLLLYLALALLGFRIAARATSRFAQLAAGGLTLAIVLQAAINVAVVTASVPNTGIPLPFISYGGSQTFFYLAAVGILLSVARSLPRAEASGAAPRASRDTAPIRETAAATSERRCIAC